MERRIFINSKIFSIDLKGNESYYSAMVIENGKFIFLGNDTDALKYKNNNTEIIDLKEKLVIPSFSNCHGHMSLNAEFLYTANLNDMDFEENEDTFSVTNKYLKQINNYYKENPNIKVLRASGWSTKMYSPDTFPNKYDLDKISTDIPICVQSKCHHFYWVNSKALELAGIDKNTPSPTGSYIYKDKKEEPTGIIQEFSAKRLIENAIQNFDYTIPQYKEAILDFCNKYSRMGVLSCYDAIPTENALKAYEELAKDNMLTIRFRCAYTSWNNDTFKQFDEIIKNFKGKKYFVSDLLKTDSVKFFNDGVGYLCLYDKEFENYKGYYGSTIWNTYTLAQAFIKLLKAGLHIHVHSIGEGTTRETLNALEYAEKFTEIYDRRNAITHLCRIKDREIEKISKLNVIAVLQPYWMVGNRKIDSDPPTDNEIAKITYKNQSLLNKNIIVCGSDDFPVDGGIINPIEAIQCGITRHLTKNQITKYKIKNIKYEKLQPFCMPKECVSLKNMIKEYTINGAFANGFDAITGSIELGKSADFQVLDKNLFELNPNDIEDTKVEMVFFKGNKI